MSILAKNMKTIRRELKCTQSALAEILKVGFRTYVRYEAGERDAPISILVKMSRLGNISLEQLLTEEISNFHITPVQVQSLSIPLPEVKSIDFRTGQIAFKKPAKECLLALEKSEKKVLSVYRKLSPALQADYLKSFEKTYKASRKISKASRVIAIKFDETQTLPVRSKLPVNAAQPKPVKSKKKGRPGRKRLNKKVLKEQIDQLKSITKSIPKITVR